MDLRQVLKERKISVPQLSTTSGVPVRTIEDIKARGDCLVSTAIKLANALNMTLDELCK